MKERYENVTDEEIAVKLEGHDHEIGSLKHRMSDQEEQNKTIQELVLSVKELALNMQAMLREQGEQGKRLTKLEAEPAERWNTMTRTIFTSLISTIGGGLAVGLILMIAQYVK